MTLTSLQRQKFEVLKRAMQGEPDAIDAVVTSLDPSEVYFLGIADDTPYTMNSEGTWETLKTFTIPGLPTGLYKFDVFLQWNVDANQTRTSAIRWQINSVETDPLSAVTDSAADQINLSSFFDIDYTQGGSPLDITLQGILESGGGTAQLNFTDYRIRLERVTGSNLSVSSSPTVVVTP